MLTVVAVPGINEIKEGDDLAKIIVDATRASGTIIQDHDIIVVTQKIVSKAEGRVVAINTADAVGEHARIVAEEAIEILARRGDLVIARTKHGLVCANAGVDASNVEAGNLCLLPIDPDSSARGIATKLREQLGVSVGVVISDTFGRPWRLGQVNVAIGVAGFDPIQDLIGKKDAHGNPLHATQIAVADQIASAAEMVMGKSDQIPVAIVRGLTLHGNGSAADLIRNPSEDLFPRGLTQ